MPAISSLGKAVSTPVMVPCRSGETQTWPAGVRQQIADHRQFLPCLDLRIALQQCFAGNGTANQAVGSLHAFGLGGIQQVTYAGQVTLLAPVHQTILSVLAVIIIFWR